MGQKISLACVKYNESAQKWFVFITAIRVGRKISKNVFASLNIPPIFLNKNDGDADYYSVVREGVLAALIRLIWNKWKKDG